MIIMLKFYQEIHLIFDIYHLMIFLIIFNLIIYLIFILQNVLITISMLIIQVQFLKHLISIFIYPLFYFILIRLYF